MSRKTHGVGLVVLEVIQWVYRQHSIWSKNPSLAWVIRDIGELTLNIGPSTTMAQFLHIRPKFIFSCLLNYGIEENTSMEFVGFSMSLKNA